MPEDPNGDAFVAKLRAIAPDFIFSFYYRHMLSVQALGTASRGAYNMHGSLLPRYRGRVPINWAVLKGESETGATLHRMEAKPDAGGIVDQMAVPILPDDLALDVFRKVTVAAEIVLHRSLPASSTAARARARRTFRKAATSAGASPRTDASTGLTGAKAIHDLVRAVAPPYPGAFTDLQGHRLFIHRTRVLPGRVAAGRARLQVGKDAVTIDCADGGQLAILEAALDGHAAPPAKLLGHFGSRSL
jgi:methionyl-tRNA formyltransferase